MLVCYAIGMRSKKPGVTIDTFPFKLLPRAIDLTVGGRFVCSQYAFILDGSSHRGGAFDSCNIEALEAERDYWRGRGGVGEANRLEAQAAFLREIEAEPAKTNFIWEFELCDRDYFQPILYLARTEPRALDLIQSFVLKYINAIKELAETGHAGAIEVFARLCLDSAAYLNRLETVNLDALRNVAQQEHAWPVFKSKNKAFSQGERRILRLLQVGEKLNFRISTNPLTIPKTKFGPLAWQLWHYVDRLHRKMKSHLNEEERQTLLDPLRQQNARDLTIGERLLSLPDFGAKDSIVNLWVRVAAMALRHSYPQIEDLPKNLQNPLQGQKTSRQWNHIEQRIEREFRGFAGLGKGE